MVVGRRRVVWLWIAAVSGVLLLLAGMVLCIQLPRWAPEWVINHSPLVEPIVRAVASIQLERADTPEANEDNPVSFDYGPLENQARERIQKWGLATLPALKRCLAHGGIEVRLQAMDLLSMFNEPGREQAQAMLSDANPWIRSAGWERLTNLAQGMHVKEGAYEAVVDASIQLLSDPDRVIRNEASDYLVRRGENLWLRRDEILPLLEKYPAPELMTILLSEEVQHLDEDEPLSRENLFSLLRLGQRSELDEPSQRNIATALAQKQQDLSAIFARLTAMHRGERPWAPGAEPWMYEHLNRLFSEQVTLAVTEVDATDLLRHHFLNGNIVIDPALIAAVPPPVTLMIDHQPLAIALTTLADAIDARLQLRHGVTFLSSGARPWYGQIRGFVPGATITLAPGADPEQATMKQWHQALQRRCSIDCRQRELPMAQFFAELSRQGGIPIDVQAMSFADGTSIDALYLHDLPLEQILCFMADYLSWDQQIRLELSPAGIRMYPAEAP